MTEQQRPPEAPPGDPENPSRRRLLGGLAIAGAALAAGCRVPLQDIGRTSAATGSTAALDAALRERIRHVVVIYCENRSFNNLFADFPGLQQPLSAVPPERLRQRDRDGSLLDALPPIWDGMVPDPQELAGRTWHIGEAALAGLPNAPWPLRTPDGAPLPRGLVTRDLMHVFYRNQMQINGGRNDGFVAWGDSGALVMGHYMAPGADSALWNLARRYTLCDNFFMGAFGGSFLNHQYLVAARPPVYPGADRGPARHRIAVLEDGPLGHRLKLADDSPPSAMQGPPKFESYAALTPDLYAVNTCGPPFAPSFNRDPHDPSLADPSHGNILPPQDYPTIGDTLSAAGIDWAWYSGAWQMALDGHGKHGLRSAFPQSPNFQPHHQPFNYFRQFGPGTAARRQHLRDAGVGGTASTNHFIADIERGRLPAVSFYKPQGDLNMHAGYSSVEAGDRHIHDVVAALEAGPLWEHTMVVITVDENGGWWDHVPPPKADRWGPGTRIPALVVSPHARRGHVEHAIYDTGSIQRFLNRRFGLAPLAGIALRDESMRRHNGFAPGDLIETLDLD